MYPPLNVLKRVGDGIWIVDSGPLRTFGLELPVRMTVARLADGNMWLHSPTQYDEQLRLAIERLGPIRHLIAPNVAHWSFLKDWQSACPSAATWAAPGLRERSEVRRSGVVLDEDLHFEVPDAWAADFEQVVVPGGFGVNEVAFLHRPSRTLVLTDLIQNFEQDKISTWARPLAKLAGVLAPDGQAPVHLRFAIGRRREAAQIAARRMIGWQPDRVIFAHGRWFDWDGTGRLKKSLRWLVDER